MEFGGRPDGTDSARLGCQPADVQHRRGARRAELLERGVRRRGQVQGQGHRLRLPIYIADAALYLSKTKPDLGIKDPYSLTSEQLDAAIELLKKQRENISEYWSDYTKEVQAFESGTSR